MTFTPSESEQRLPPLYYRGCWHRVSRGFLRPYRQATEVLSPLPSSGLTELYDPKAFIAHAASHCHPFGHCKRSSTAAPRRSLGSVSVPVWLTILSDQLPVNSLGGPLPHQLADRTQAPLQTAACKQRPPFTAILIEQWSYPVLAHLSISYPEPDGRLPTRYSPVRHYPPIARGIVRLACLNHAASVRSEPGSNSPKSNTVRSYSNLVLAI